MQTDAQLRAFRRRLWERLTNLVICMYPCGPAAIPIGHALTDKAAQRQAEILAAFGLGNPNVEIIKLETN